MNAQARGWGDPDAAGYRARHVVRVDAGGITLYVRREIAPLVAGFVDEIAARGYRLDGRADDWSYANRCVRGTGPGTRRACVKSNHSWGLAIDLNAVANPMTSDGRVHTDMPRWVADTARRWGLFWGGDYSGLRKDPMHFEFLGTPADAAAIVARLTHSTPATPAPTRRRAPRMILAQEEGQPAVLLFFGRGNWVPIEDPSDRDRVLATGIPFVPLTPRTMAEWKRAA